MPPAPHPSFCLFSLSAGSGAVGQHSLIRKFEIIARRGFDAVELMNDDLVAFAESDEFGRIYRNADLPSPSLSPEDSPRSVGQPSAMLDTYNAMGPCSLNTLHREVAAAAFIGLLSKSLGIKVATLQPVRDVEGWADEEQRAEAFRRFTSRFEICHALGTNMLLICSNCQPSESLVSASDYAKRAGADLAEVAELAAQWTPMEATARWRKHGCSDPVELMRRAFRHYRPPTPLSPPESRSGSVADAHEAYLPGQQPALSHLSSLVSAAMRQLPSLSPSSTPSSSTPSVPYTPIRIGYEALSWGTHVSLWRAAWDVVQAANHPNVGIVLDSFNTVAREWADPCSPSGISQPEHEADERLSQSIAMMGDVLIPEKIFFLQIADAKRVPVPLAPSPSPTEPRPSRMIWSRSNRLFPLEKERGAFLPIVEFVQMVHSIGYRGPWSVEVFSDSIHEQDMSVPITHVDRGFRSLERLVEAVHGQ
ncbi:hypothetical protein OC845_000401 [Tilletia horrida]|nr:hypothetical protein OC845_000401 [Tilletia horrida]